MKSIVSLALIFYSAASLARKVDWNDGFLELQVTRCFPAEDVRAKCDDPWSDGEGGQVTEFEITATNGTGKFTYSDGRTIGASFCHSRLKTIQKLMKKTKLVCITGEDEQKSPSFEISSRWISLETSKGEIRR